MTSPYAPPPQAPAWAAANVFGVNQVITYAGFWKRFVAAFIDGIVIMIGGFAVGLVLGITMILSGFDDPDTLNITANVLGYLLQWIYFSAMESSPLQGTLGKLAIGIKVTDMDGNRIGFGKATLRYIAKIPSALLFLVGFLMVAFTERKQGLHDMIASCLVVNK